MSELQLTHYSRVSSTVILHDTSIGEVIFEKFPGIPSEKAGIPANSFSTTKGRSAVILQGTSSSEVIFEKLCCSVLQCVAVCCSVLQCVAVCCSVLQCVAVCCSVLQCVAID